MELFKNLFGGGTQKTLKTMRPLVEKVNALESEIQKLSDEELREKTKEFQTRLNKNETLDDILPEAFAVVRETAKRVLGQRHYDVQLMGGIALHQGNISEMRTGEGKTLVATLPVYLNALEGKGVHVVTVNDYLSRRDAVWMGQIYAFLGLSVGVINHESSYLYDAEHKSKEDDEVRDELGSFKVEYEFLRPCTRREAYAADITYGTNNEFGFDYLRDNLAYASEALVQRDYHFAIVDEIDSILIDEARTPLIISAISGESEDLYVKFARIAERLKPDEDYEVDEKLRAIQLTDEGITKAEKLLGVENIYTEGGIKDVHHLETAVRAKALFERDKEYVIRDGEIIIVDEFTGRLQPGRRWSEGLHQAVEAKEGVTIQKESRTVASITFQNYFRMYKKLAGMTGTASTSREEFYKVYGLDVTEVPTNVPVQRIDKNDLIYQTEIGKFKAIAARVKEVHEKNQPILIGTVSIEKNELLSAFLQKEGVPHQVLNAKNHENEGEIIAQAGKKGSVVIATNLAGRGVDIKLGGNPGTEETYEEIKQLGGLFVLGTERHEARRIDNQLRGRSGRQGDPGETQFFVSLEDSLMRVFAADAIKRMMGTFGIPEDQPIENKIISRSLETAQTKIEGFHFDSRRNVLQYDNVLAQQRNKIYERRRKILLGDMDFIREFLDELIAGDDDAAKLVEKKKAELGEEDFLGLVRRLFLQLTDMLWMDHLEAMEYLRSSVGLRAYGQRDPLVEYKKEGLQMFHDMEDTFRSETIRLIGNIGGGMFVKAEQEAKEMQKSFREAGGEEGKADASTKKSHSPATEEKIGRNDVVEITDGKETKSMKYKKALPLIEGGSWRLVK
ncbi:MAG TPA: preprotein translocase subunit SecA [Candidatus Paceibacterota bacterium]|nr:preprotein translocase subunit SecA [Candidatus Paceibacterota bacterium]